MPETVDNVYRLVMDEPPTPRPSKQIRMWQYDPCAEIARIVDESMDALMEANIPVFKRNFRLQMAIWEERTTSDDTTVQVPAFVPVDTPMLDYTLNKRDVAIYYAKKKGRSRQDDHFERVSAPERVLRTIVNTKHWKAPLVIGMIHCPTMRPDGSLILHKGYDAATKFYIFWDKKLAMPQIANNPTKPDAQHALQSFLDLLVGFPFVKELDKAVAVAAIITPILRAAFDSAPLFLILSHQSGTGKSFMQDVISSIVNGQYCPVVNAHGEMIEMEKRLSALLMEGMPIIALDNLTKDLDSSLLCQMISQRAVKVRVLGKSEMREIEWRGMLVANGNNVRVCGDLVRRTLTANMSVPESERPEQRQFKFDPVRYILADRGKYIAAALTLARAYQLATDKPALPGYAGFERWSNCVRAPLIWLGMPDVLDSQEQSRHDDPVRSTVLELMDHWQQRFGLNTPRTAAEIVAAANQEWDSEFHALLMQLAGIGTRQLSSRRLGHYLMTIHGQVNGGRRIDMVHEATKGNKYALIAV
jgi:putative DNA primase/helicase